MDLERLIAALGPAEVLGSPSLEVLDLAYDTRAVARGAVFFCVPGTRADGHDFAEAAVENGATALGGERRGVQRTTPEAIDLQRTFREMLDAGDRSCVMEASSHASVLHRLDCVRFRVLVFTNLSQDHLDFHGDMESYFQAKRRLFFA